MTICIGGIAAGRWIDSRDNDYATVAEVPAVPYKQFDGMPPTMKVVSSTYRKMPLTYRRPNGTEETFWFFVDDRIRDEFDLIRELANGYRPVCVSKL